MVKIIIHSARPGLVIGKKGQEVDVLRKNLATMLQVSSVDISVEEVKTPDDPDWQEAHILATNVYLKTPQGWRIVIHHASVAPGKAADDLGSAAAMLH